MMHTPSQFPIADEITLLRRFTRTNRPDGMAGVSHPYLFDARLAGQLSRSGTPHYRCSGQRQWKSTLPGWQV
jgi:hypothetical protein